MPSSTDSSLSRRERERRTRRRAMLDAAQSVFAEKGYARATLEEIADRAEFGKGTLYNYFEGGKEQLLFAIFDDIFDDVHDLIASAFAVDRLDEASLRTLYHDYVVRAFRFFQERDDLFIILIKEAYRLAFSDDHERAAYFHRQRERMVNAAVPAIEAAMERGSVRTLPPHAVAHMLLENLDDMFVHRCLAERREEEDACVADDLAMLHEPEAAADFLAAMLFDGLLGRDAA